VIAPLGPVIVGADGTLNVPFWPDVFFSVNVSVAVVPGVTLLFVVVFVSVGVALIVVLSAGLVAALPAFVCAGSLPPYVAAVLEIAFVPVGVPVPTFTAIVIALPFAPEAITVVDVHEIDAVPPPVQVQPVPVGLPFAVRLFGSVSVTVTVPDVAALPVFFGVIVYVAPDWPIVHGPLSDFVNARLGAFTVSVAVAETDVDVAPPAVTVAPSRSVID
jgi:hypothetical protein